MSTMGHLAAQEAAAEIVKAAAQSGSLKLFGANGNRTPAEAAEGDVEYLQALIAGLIKAFRQPDPVRQGQQ